MQADRYVLIKRDILQFLDHFKLIIQLRPQVFRLILAEFEGCQRDQMIKYIHRDLIAHFHSQFLIYFSGWIVTRQGLGVGVILGVGVHVGGSMNGVEVLVGIDSSTGIVGYGKGFNEELGLKKMIPTTRSTAMVAMINKPLKKSQKEIFIFNPLY